MIEEEADETYVPVDELAETENAFAVLFVKDGEKVNFVRVSVTNEDTTTTSTQFQPSNPTALTKINPDSTRMLENRRTFQVEKIILTILSTIFIKENANVAFKDEKSSY